MLFRTNEPHLGGRRVATALVSGIVALLASLGGGAASAADLPPAPPAEVEIAPVDTEFKAEPFDWTGIRVGAHAGYAWGHDDFTMSPNTVTPGGRVKFEPTGGFGGLQAGYLHQFDNNVVLGAMADIGTADISGSANYSGGFPGAKAGNRVDWLGTTTARVGYAFDRFLPFASGGLAFANGDGYMKVPLWGRFGESKVNTGWTVGGGLEYAVTDNLSMSGEYQRLDFGAVKYNVGANALSMRDESDYDIVKFGLNYTFK